MERVLLIVDGVINFALGLLLLVFPADLVQALGLPVGGSRFYPSLLGAVLLGISLALFLELLTDSSPLRGLGLAGAVSINLTGGAVLASWLLFGGLDLPVRGLIFLWTLVALLVGLSLVELFSHLREEKA